MDVLPDMADFPGYNGIAPDPESSLARPIATDIAVAASSMRSGAIQKNNAH
jgi:hypothetical protein